MGERPSWMPPPMSQEEREARDARERHADGFRRVLRTRRRMDELGVASIEEAFKELSRSREAMAEVAAVLVQLDELAELWGDEAKFRRCRGRLRAVVDAKGGG